MISFELTEEQRMIVDTVEAFARDEIRPAARAADEEGRVPADLVQKIWDLGLVRTVIPEEFGGDGGQRSAVSGAVVGEALAYGDLAIAIHALAPRLVAYPILEMGTDEQRARYLPAFAASEFRPAAAALMEPRWDFDVLSIAATAVKSGGGYVLNGEKCYVPLAHESELVMVYASANPAAGAVDAFLVPRGCPGMTVGEREKNMGLKALPTYGLQLKDCALGAEARLGGERGINFPRLISEAKVALASMAVGVSRAAFEYARDYALQRRAFGEPIAAKQAIAFMLAEMAIEVDASRLLVWEAASRLDKGEDAFKESYQTKNYAAAAALKIADNAVQILGGHGYIREHPVEMWLRNARGFAALEGLTTI
ncbi:MAG TPA: acyl-CoA dehydrogenase family protein [Candidatus Binataceae bacterium]|jgi:acyl-CoA dehydrogenase|nr:acyl-CoA dehydrogenase family protein [Candidatus Binataceae bacterium]